MTNRDTMTATPHDSAGERESSTEAALSSAASMATEAAGLAKQAASDTASALTQEAKQLLNKQVGRGAELVGNLGSSVKAAARELDSSAPQLAGIAHALANRVGAYATELDGQSIEQLVRKASGLTRRQPALVFGLTALAGFFALRTLKSAPGLSSAEPRAAANSANSEHAR